MGNEPLGNEECVLHSAFLGFSLKLDAITKQEKRCKSSMGQVKLSNFNLHSFRGKKKKPHILT